MPTLNQYQVNNTGGQMYFSIVQNPVVEPLDGPLFIEHLMARFPEEIYSKSRDSHLYRLLTALAGDSGAGILKKKSLLARLQFESNAMSFQDLDNLYSPLIGFDRLPNEKYLINPKTSTLTQEEWDAIKAADTAYRKRALQYLQAARQGGTLQGIKDAASAALGQSVHITENYKYKFDDLSDDQVGYKKYGATESVSEFIIRPDVNKNVAITKEFATLNVFNTTADPFYFLYKGEESAPLVPAYLTADTIQSVIEGLNAVEQNDVSVIQTTTTSYTVMFLRSDLTIQDLKISSDSGTFSSADVSLLQSAANDLFYLGDFGDPSYEFYDAYISGSDTSGIEPRSTARDYIDPYIQKNLDTVISRIKPVSTVFTVAPSRERYISIPTNGVFASSEKFSINRFVTANTNINYPAAEKVSGKILESGVENEERNYPFTAIDMPVVFLTIDTVLSYSDTSTYDANYNTELFYSGSDPIYKRYESYHAGLYGDPVSKIYPFLQSVNENALFSSQEILAVNNTNAIFKGAVT
jgi:hypothetical protein